MSRNVTNGSPSPGPIRIRPAAAPSSYELERCEVLESVFDALRRRPADPDQADACALLMRHLNGYRKLAVNRRF